MCNLCSKSYYENDIVNENYVAANLKIVILDPFLKIWKLLYQFNLQLFVWINFCLSSDQRLPGARLYIYVYCIVGSQKLCDLSGQVLGWVGINNNGTERVQGWAGSTTL